MSEKYTKVFELPENIYAKDSPVIISAGALFKHNQTFSMVAQLKIKNITDKVIKAVRISLTPFDIIGVQIDDVIKYEYLDLFVKRNSEFGQQIPIKFTNDKVRAFSIYIKQIIFTDNSIWSNSEQEWLPLPKLKLLTEVFQDDEMIKQYKIEYGEFCKYEIVEIQDIWICTCGQINKSIEECCFNCGSNLQMLKSPNLEKLNIDKNKRVKDERKKEQQASKKRKKQIIIALVTVIITIIITRVSFDYKYKINQYNNAIKNLNNTSQTTNEHYPYTKNEHYQYTKLDSAIDDLIKLGKFKNSQEILYNKAESLMADSKKEYENFNFRRSMKIYSYLGDYNNSNEKAYNNATEAFNNHMYYNAYYTYNKLKDYKDSKAKLKESYLYWLIIGYDKNIYQNKSKYEGKYEDKIYITDILKIIDTRPINETEIKNIIVGTWLVREPDLLYNSLYYFKVNGTMLLEHLLMDGKGRSWSDSFYKWDTTGQGLSIKETSLRENKKNSLEKFLEISDNVMVAYDLSDSNVVTKIYIRENSEWYKKYLEICKELSKNN